MKDRDEWGQYFLPAFFLAIVLVAAVASCTADAKPPQGVTIDPELHEWFERQKNQGGSPCCSVADGHMLEEDAVRIVGDHYEVNINNKWHKIEPRMMRQNALDDPNPTGKAVVWYVLFEPALYNELYEGVYIYCFAPGYTG